MLEWCSLFTQNQSNLVVFFTSKQLNKGVETQNKEGIELFLWIGFLIPCKTHGMNIHIGISLLVVVMVCLIYGKLDAK